jgi:glycosyltransferase involved in cell wall biosynthesis
MDLQSSIHTAITEDSETAGNKYLAQKTPVIIFCKTFLKGGAEKQALLLSRLFSERKYEVTLINWSGRKIDPENKAFVEKNSINYIGLEGSPLMKFRLLLNVTKQYESPLIFAYLTLANVVSAFLSLFNRDLRTVGGIRTEHLPFQKLLFERVVHNRLNTCTVFNSYVAREKFLGLGFNPEKMKVIHNAIQAPALSKIHSPIEAITIVSVSRFVRSKDFHTALYAYKKLVEKCPGKIIRYRIVGYGYHERAIRTLIKTLDLVSNVELLIRPRGIYAILREADIYLSTSLFEGLSNSIMEAMAAGLPVVATDVGDNRYLVQNGFNGFLVGSRDTEAIVDRLSQLVESQQVRNEFGNNGYEKIVRDFSEEKLFRSYEALLADITLKK